MKNISEMIRTRIADFEPGAVFLTGEFSDVACNSTIRQSLQRMCKTGEIRRVMDGVYEKPAYSALLQEYMPTDPEAVAYALAKHYHWNISPCGDIALNKLKLSTQVPMVWSYISDGPYREFSFDDKKIFFRHRANRNISGMSPITVTVIEALKSLGKERVNDKVLNTLKRELSEEDKHIVFRESSSSADWIRSVIKEVYAS